MDFGNAPILRTLAGRTNAHRHRPERRPRVGARSRRDRARWSGVRQVGPRHRQRRRRDHVGLGRRRAARLLSGDARDADARCWRRVRLATARWPGAPSPPDGGGAPVTVMPGVVFFGVERRNRLRVLDDRRQRVVAVRHRARVRHRQRRARRRAATINAAGPVVAGGMLFVPSGYSELGNGVRGNVLLAFGVRQESDRWARRPRSELRPSKTQRSSDLDPLRRCRREAQRQRVAFNPELTPEILAQVFRETASLRRDG